MGRREGEIETGDRMSTTGLDKLARRGSLITGGPSSSELIFSIPPGAAWLLGGPGGPEGGEGEGHPAPVGGGAGQWCHRGAGGEGE